jgi:hypothetical protein
MITDRFQSVSAYVIPHRRENAVWLSLEELFTILIAVPVITPEYISLF